MRLWLRVFVELVMKDLCWDYLRYCGLVTCGWCLVSLCSGDQWPHYMVCTVQPPGTGCTVQYTVLGSLLLTRQL